MFTKKNSEPQTSMEPTVAPSARMSKSTPSLISVDMTVFGNIESDGEIQIDGAIVGDVSSSALVVGTNARITGDVTSENVHIRGSVEGTVRARAVILVSGCRVIGDIINQSLEIEKGSHFEGASRHSDDPLTDRQEQQNQQNSESQGNNSSSDTANSAGVSGTQIAESSIESLSASSSEEFDSGMDEDGASYIPASDKF